MKEYVGFRKPDHDCAVLVCDPPNEPAPLNPRLDIWNHSPDGFNWGYSGSGPAQLALALLADALGDDQAAVRLHQDFKRQFIASMSLRRWKVTASFIVEWARDAEK